jgi:6-phosphogluconolactonase (cycloisomerase 2 family)
LTPLPGTVVATNTAGATNLDLAVSTDGAFLYSLNSGTGSIGVFGIDPRNGALMSLGAVGAFRVNAGFNGIAAN